MILLIKCFANFTCNNVQGLTISLDCIGLDPVVNEEDFKIQVSSWMEKAFSLKFRDDAEIMQVPMEYFLSSKCLNDSSTKTLMIECHVF